MEIILSALFLLVIWGYFKHLDAKACNYSQSHQIDWGKVNHDRTINDLSNSQVNKNIISGKYNNGRIRTQAEIKASQDVAWEDFKRRHPHGSWN